MAVKTLVLLLCMGMRLQCQNQQTSSRSAGRYNWSIRLDCNRTAGGEGEVAVAAAVAPPVDVVMEAPLAAAVALEAAVDVETPVVDGGDDDCEEETSTPTN